MNKIKRKNLKIGDIVIINARGKNYGKRGIVTKIGTILDVGYTGIFLKPLNCDFEFGKKEIMYRYNVLKLENEILK